MANNTGGDPPQSVSLMDAEQRSSSTLSTLVPHLLAAQRSLWSMEHVSQAQNVIRSSREAIELQTGMAAHTQYVNLRTQELFGTVGKVNGTMEDVRRATRTEAEHLMERVELSRSRLEQTVEALKRTAYDEKLRGQSHVGTDAVEGRPTQSLMDFLDESGLEELLGRLDDCCHSLSTIDNQFDMSIANLMQEKDKLNEMFNDLAPAPEAQVSMLPILEEMEISHSEMTANMESLIEHYDRCKTAVHHTEGGGAAALKMGKDIPDGIDLGLEKDQPPQDISKEEMEELRIVVENDAAEVDEVVAEIRASMEGVQTAADRVTQYGERIKNRLNHARATFMALKTLGKTLPGKITESQLYSIKCEEERAKILEHVEEIEVLRHVYLDFLKAYDHLLIEIGRRKDVQRRINAISDNAMKKINEIIDEEFESREAFIRDHEDILPLEIWPGLPLPPSRYEFVKVQDAQDSLPDISASVINKAIKRVSQDGR